MSKDKTSVPTLTSFLHPPNGYHPISTTTIHTPPPPIAQTLQNCTAHLLYTLPPLIFVDKHELANYHDSYTFHHWGTSNLEYPVFAVDASDSLLLLNFVGGGYGKDVSIKVPLHLRYGKPASPGPGPGLGPSKGRYQYGYDEAELKWPLGFFACPASANVASFGELSRLPDKVLRVLTQNSTKDIKILTITPAVNDNGETVQTVRVPVGNSGDLAFVEFGTAFTIFLLFWYLVRVTRRTMARLQSKEQAKDK
ncbi:hypothetical protein AX17_001830 [Amanita inopinata Kibby_2008]|nr:hypothetical protein AX17_001830 [Amanita inopinata Kibby_2008]